MTRPQPLQEEDEEEAGEEEQEEVASQSVRKKEEEEPNMPSIQVKPEPEEMECTVSIDWLIDQRREGEMWTDGWMRISWVLMGGAATSLTADVFGHVELGGFHYSARCSDPSRVLPCQRRASSARRVV